MKKNVIILSALIIIFSSVVLISYYQINNNSFNDYNFNNGNSEKSNPNNVINNSITPIFNFDIDKYNKTITIISIEEGTDLYWYNVKYLNGTATLPTGSIDEGDIITDCIGKLDFKWIPTNEVFLHCEFVRGD
jgi:hypothetical protein